MRNKKFILKNFTLIIGICILASCQKVIDIDLNSVSPQIVIEGSIDDKSGNAMVTITKTVNFSESNVFPYVEGAIVTLSNDSGYNEILTEISSGTYKSSLVYGEIGEIYYLNVSSNDEEYAATSNIPSPVDIDTIIIENSFGFGPNNNKYVNVQFTDPIGVDNYYRLVESINDTVLNAIFITSDKERDGETFQEILISQSSQDSDSNLNSGDSVTIQLQSIDKYVYEYFRTLNELNSSGFSSSTPANPTSNLSNGALGYFNAYSVTSKTIVIP